MKKVVTIMKFVWKKRLKKIGILFGIFLKKKCILYMTYYQIKFWWKWYKSTFKKLLLSGAVNREKTARVEMISYWFYDEKF